MDRSFRFTHVAPVDGKPAIKDYIDYKLVSLEKAIEPLTPDIFNEIIDYANDAKRATENISLHDGLTHDEGAAIYLYSMETHPRSVYRMLNSALNENLFPRLSPWFLYLKLLHSAILFH